MDDGNAPADRSFVVAVWGSRHCPKAPHRWLFMAVLLLAFPAPLPAAEGGGDAFQSLAQRYSETARPLLHEFCLECHSTANAEGELDLERFATLDDVRRDPLVWQRVAEMLGNGEMPPEDAEPRPTDDQRQQLRDWVAGYLHAEALANAGDPGPVLLRRLNNAQYVYTIRDLTGVDLDPASEFPVDGAAGEGFTNTGNALVMSPSLLRKYLDAAKDIASHAVLLPDGFRFSASSNRRDWTNQALARIRDFYRRFTGAGADAGGTRVNLQGVEFETNSGGRLRVEQYLAATLTERDSLRSGETTVAEVAARHGLNAKYLGILWGALHDTEPSLLLDAVRAAWRTSSVADASELAADIGQWQRSLFRFSSVGHIGKVGGPTAWQQSTSPLAVRHEIRTKLPPLGATQDVVLTLVVGDAGDGSEGDFALWERPRIVTPGGPELLLRDLEPAGLDAARFGRHPNGSAVDAASICVAAPEVLEVRLPAEVAAGAEFVTSGSLHSQSGGQGSVQFQVLVSETASGEDPPPLAVPTSGILPNAVAEIEVAGPWTSETSLTAYTAPIVTLPESAARVRFEQSFEDFRQLFPAALCYMEIVPVDEVVTLTLFYREDEPLRRLMLSEEQAQQLDQLWQELHFISRDALTLVDAFEQLLEYASQDADPAVFEPLREPIEQRAAEFRQALVAAEPAQIEAVVQFAAQAYRRPLSATEAEELRELYRTLREEDLSHEEALRFTLARIFVAPAFLYRLEQAPAGSESAPVSDWELASRLSYFLWSSQPDEELRESAAAGRLQDGEELARQTRRMLNSPHVRRLATEFACQWLHIYDFHTLDEKSHEQFGEFEGLRDAMYEESILFFTDLFRRDASILQMFDADHTFLNAPLAEFYGIALDPAKAQLAGNGAADGWYRVEGVRSHGRGGILGLAAALAKHSGASRSSPILRGVWVSEALLGEKLPDPPPGVPPFPEDAAVTADLTVRQITEMHTRDPDCAGCHARIDPFGFALEGYDAIGRFRERDAAGRPLDTRSRLPDGADVSGLADLREYLLNARRDALLDQFCRKLLGYALGRGVQISDQPLLEDMRRRLTENDHRFFVAVETIVQSRQFREIRGRDVGPASSSH